MKRGYHVDGVEIHGNPPLNFTREKGIERFAHGIFFRKRQVMMGTCGHLQTHILCRKRGGLRDGCSSSGCR